MARVAIVTSFAEFTPGYSLTGIVEDQINMLASYGHEVHLWVCEHFKRETASERVMLAELHDTVPFANLVDYQREKDLSEEHGAVVRGMADILAAELRGMDVVLTHDLIFTGLNLPYGLGIRQASPRLPGLTWFHWIHSIPSVRRDWWDLKAFGSNHRLVYPNKSDAGLAARQYRCAIDDVEVIPHIKDMRTWADFHPDTCLFIYRHPAVMQADIVQILPASQDRLKWKRVPEVIRIFGELKTRGKSVCLVVANQWASQTTYKQNMEEYKALARANGLMPGDEFVFTSDFDFPRFEVGIPKRMVRELMSLSNLFIFPTHHETFGLVVPEAGLSGALLVLNRSLGMQMEITERKALYFDFGSYKEPATMRPGWVEYMSAQIIVNMDTRSQSIRTRTLMRQKYNWDSIYKNHYQNILHKKSVGKAA